MADNLYEQITEIERKIARLPEGGIAKKTIKDNPKQRTIKQRL